MLFPRRWDTWHSWHSCSALLRFNNLAVYHNCCNLQLQWICWRLAKGCKSTRQSWEGMLHHFGARCCIALMRNWVGRLMWSTQTHQGENWWSHASWTLVLGMFLVFLIPKVKSVDDAFKRVQDSSSSTSAEIEPFMSSSVGIRTVMDCSSEEFGARVLLFWIFLEISEIRSTIAFWRWAVGIYSLYCSWFT